MLQVQYKAVDNHVKHETIVNLMHEERCRNFTHAKNYIYNKIHCPSSLCVVQLKKQNSNVAMSHIGVFMVPNKSPIFVQVVLLSMP